MGGKDDSRSDTMQLVRIAVINALEFVNEQFPIVMESIQKASQSKSEIKYHLLRRLSACLSPASQYAALLIFDRLLSYMENAVRKQSLTPPKESGHLDYTVNQIWLNWTRSSGVEDELRRAVEWGDGVDESDDEDNGIMNNLSRIHKLSRDFEEVTSGLDEALFSK